jgi:hypothetical protein
MWASVIGMLSVLLVLKVQLVLWRSAEGATGAQVPC